MRVAVTARTAGEVSAVADEIGGLALVGDVSRREDVESWVERVEDELGPIDLLVNCAGIAQEREAVPRRGAGGLVEASSRSTCSASYLCCRAVVPLMKARGGGRIVNVGSGGSYLPVTSPTTALGTSYGPSKAALGRFGETLAAALQPAGIAVFVISPGLVRTAMTESFGDNAPWTPPELAPQLVRVLASGRADALAGRYIHAEHDDIEDLIRRADEIAENDLNAIRLRR